jgi:hypothetical protein
MHAQLNAKFTPGGSMSYRISNYLYILLMLTGLIIVAGPALAQTVSLDHVASIYINEGESAMGVTISGNIAYCACDFGGIRLYDITNPSSPVFLGSCSTPSFARNVAVRGNYAYVADGDSGLQVIDVSNSAAPVMVGNYETAGTAITVRVAGNYAYLADGYTGLLVVNIANPSSPTLVGTYNDSGYPMGVALAGNYAYVATTIGSGQLQAIDITDPANPIFVGSANFGSNEYGVCISGNYAYVGAYAYGMGIFDISTPGHPALMGSYNVIDPGNVRRTFATDTLAFVTQGLSGIVMLNVSNPASPVVIDSADTYGNTADVVMSGDYVYVADDYSFEIFHITTTMAPSCQYVVGSINGDGTFNGLDVVYAVSYLKGGNAPPYSCECTPSHSWFVAGDVNASCNFNGVDVTYMVSYFKGGPGPHPCADCPPAR